MKSMNIVAYCSKDCMHHAIDHRTILESSIKKFCWTLRIVQYLMFLLAVHLFFWERESCSWWSTMQNTVSHFSWSLWYAMADVGSEGDKIVRTSEGSLSVQRRGLQPFKVPPNPPSNKNSSVSSEFINNQRQFVA